MKEIEHTSKYTSSQCDARGFEVRVSCRGAPCVSVKTFHTCTHESHAVTHVCVTTTMQSGTISDSYWGIEGPMYFYIFFTSKILVVQPLMIDNRNPVENYTTKQRPSKSCEYAPALDKLQTNTNICKW